MNKRITVEERLKKESKRPSDMLFKATEEKNKVVDSSDAWELKRQTFYVPNVYADALKLQKVYENTDVSETVRKALADFLNPKYIEMAKEKYK